MSRAQFPQKNRSEWGKARLYPEILHILINIFNVSVQNKPRKVKLGILQKIPGSGTLSRSSCNIRYDRFIGE